MAHAYTNLTPMLRQYFDIKAERPDVVLLMRVGDFYEAYGEDAEIIARELEITLTGRELTDARVPMAGVPHHAMERYVARLIGKGYKVAVCDQVEDPKLAKGLVKRKVTRVLTPGTIVEDAMLDAKTNNFLVAAITGAKVPSGVGRCGRVYRRISCQPRCRAMRGRTKWWKKSCGFSPLSASCCRAWKSWATRLKPCPRPW